MSFPEIKNCFLFVLYEIMKKIDLQNWNRKEHFHFFKEFEEPYFGATINLDVTDAYKKCIENGGVSFFLYYHYILAKTINETESMRLRISENEVCMFETIHVSSVILRPDFTFGFSFIPFKESFESFRRSAEEEIRKVKQSTGLGFNENTSRLDVVHCSTLPWLDFTSLSHARNFGERTGIPKFSFGKLTDHDGVKKMPLSIHVHHALMDGYHLGMFTEKLQENLKS